MAPRGANPSATTNAMAGSTGAADTEAKKIFDQLDANHDGMLSLDEFSRAKFQQPTK
jgi:Ca2+-binding EF-hand superfamily protein